jgi:expansin (peptidoglycan-binding protein)
MFGSTVVLALSLGWLLGSQAGRLGPHDGKLHAVGGYGTENFAMATGNIDGNFEGLFTLDYLTGDLQCWVINPRTGTWGGLYKTNVAIDLEVEKGKKPSFVLVTGAANFPGTAAMKRPAQCIVYVADANTGKFAGYAIAMTQGAQAAGLGEFGPMQMVAKGNARNVEVRQ